VKVKAERLGKLKTNPMAASRFELNKTKYKSYEQHLKLVDQKNC
jgi:hypothetical protein